MHLTIWNGNLQLLTAHRTWRLPKSSLIIRNVMSSIAAITGHGFLRDIYVHMDERVIEKFLISIERTNYCWIWQGHLDKHLLPVIKMVIDDTHKSKVFSPRRVSLFIAGKELPDNKPAQPLVCGNKLCVNPDHLCIGDEARFWAKVQKLDEENMGCWVWTAGHDKDMYGRFGIKINNKYITIRAHIYSWFLHTGFMPENLFVCHTCDHPYCVNPSHLFLGEAKDNSQDRNNKERQARGEKVGSSKLDAENVREIKKLFSIGVRQSHLCKMFNMSPTGIWSIVRGKLWKHIK